MHNVIIFGLLMALFGVCMYFAVFSDRAITIYAILASAALVGMIVMGWRQM